ncbi:MAG: PhnA domain-containing protein [Bacteriovoracaceae bacterium]|nr:PhnA domain-containing protein [Bacteriovoracaceae bacterium]
MSLKEKLDERSGGVCELCSAQTDLVVFEVDSNDEQGSALVCGSCESQIKGTAELDANHWRCLSGSMWSEQSPVQILSWHMLNNLKNEGWALELLDQMYMDEELSERAKAYHAANSEDENALMVKDSNGARLHDGDAVTLIKDLDVKGANFTAKRGTMVKNISLTDDPGLIEGKVNGTQIVLKTEFLKKSN